MFEGKELVAVVVVVMEAGEAEIDQQGGFGAAREKIVHHLGPLDAAQGLDGLEFDDACAVPAEEVRPVACRKRLAVVVHPETTLALEGDGVAAEFDFERVAVSRFQEAVSQRSMHAHGASDDGIRLGIVFHAHGAFLSEERR